MTSSRGLKYPTGSRRPPRVSILGTSSSTHRTSSAILSRVHFTRSKSRLKRAWLDATYKLVARAPVEAQAATIAAPSLRELIAPRLPASLGARDQQIEGPRCRCARRSRPRSRAQACKQDPTRTLAGPRLHLLAASERKAVRARLTSAGLKGQAAPVGGLPGRGRAAARRAGRRRARRRARRGSRAAQRRQRDHCRRVNG